jgi:Fic family protein
MMSFRAGRLRRQPILPSTAWLLEEIAEAKGRLEGLDRLPPQVLDVLADTARVQSVESSNRIEGVTVDPRRLRPLVVEDIQPKSRSEEEIQGYRRALDLVHAPGAPVVASPRLLLRLHALTMAGSGDAGAWKSANNEIVELRPGAPPKVRFRPTSAANTPAAVAELCRLYEEETAQAAVPSLITTAALVLDFLCIHPFRDGNGRASRLLTLAELNRHGQRVGRYISLERLIEESRDEYYDILYRSSQRWHDGEHDLVPWLSYFLGVLRRAYHELEVHVAQQAPQRGAKTAAIELAVDALTDEFTRRDLERACPGASAELVRKVLQGLQREGRVEALGRGPGATWRKR